jgi:midasin
VTRLEDQNNLEKIKQLMVKHEALFEWQDGPLVINNFINYD